ncbi:unnamed protein product [Rotaria socialis]|uniref:Ubiquitin-like domain-containing protein n=2 Tax=Rotaria socialis TaxID=392032 RepID=A0A820RAF0_9BILA|nr:unnamed protein product [Rotaria socialis]CAF3397043.1 unnamed protein product [Rotaria socialis]CAF3552253.1 unnamed protein product [Rotaria socialis]CAF3769589.1 unnamed protein product [Rotaria socialis]CAF4435615.1 unnamed protein product [Rotaria socialis]
MQMKIRRTKIPAKSITITVERLSDNSRITFTISSDKTIEQLRSLLNYHLPPYMPDKFCLYSYQRGALIHFHPSSFKLDYFPVIFDQSILLLKMDDRAVNNINIDDEKKFNEEITKRKFSLLGNFSSSSNARTKGVKKQSSSTHVTCLSILKLVFNQSSKPPDMNLEY